MNRNGVSQTLCLWLLLVDTNIKIYEIPCGEVQQQQQDNKTFQSILSPVVLVRSKVGTLRLHYIIIAAAGPGNDTKPTSHLHCTMLYYTVGTHSLVGTERHNPTILVIFV